MSAALPVPAPLSADRLRALGAEAWPLLPVASNERKDLLVDEAAALLDRLLVQVLGHGLRRRGAVRQRAARHVRAGAAAAGLARAVGGDQESNRTSVCWPHHRGIHHGFVRVRGTAPDGLRWTLGEVEGT